MEQYRRHSVADIIVSENAASGAYTNQIDPLFLIRRQTA